LREGDMRRIRAASIGVAIGVMVGLAVVTVVGRPAPERFPYGRPLGPVMSPDSGAGELLVVVEGGVYATRAEAETANASMPFNDLQGYYVVPVAQFQGFKEQVGEPGDFALVSVFRTDAGAQEFAELASSVGYPATILPTRVRSLGGLYAGLGQEANPDGSGPLLGPIPESLP
jgi:hypothetical protein